MFKNYFKTTWRNIIANKLFATLNIAGLIWFRLRCSCEALLLVALAIVIFDFICFGYCTLDYAIFTRSKRIVAFSL
jgi:hypothetical protein